ncbi:hypothetical protein EZV62_013891 [Acer yangbiense]|uniref:Uncharacterized protein n=1 Tax=Acer yangbiense TaxID=1000413 RepID=A0A5C7HR97_9ROSI|nr:hypothetical protein EZV62_013891 [Acer yangbiense]
MQNPVTASVPVTDTNSRKLTLWGIPIFKCLPLFGKTHPRGFCEVLARDRLLGAYKVKPVIKLLKQTLTGTGALLLTAVSLFIFATPVEHFFQTPFATKENNSDISASKINKKFGIRKEDLLQLPMEVKSDDDLAAAAADAAGGRTVYCRDRFYCVLAGGQYCKWEDLLK